MVTLTFKVTDLEASQLREAAANEGSTLSNFLRKKVLNDSNSSLITDFNAQKTALVKTSNAVSNIAANVQIVIGIVSTMLYKMYPNDAEQTIADIQANLNGEGD